MTSREKGKVLVFRQKQYERASTGTNAETHSLKPRGGIPSGPYSLLVSRERSAIERRKEIARRSKGSVRDASGGEVREC